MNSNRKGKDGERDAAAALSAVFGADCRRGRQYHGGPDSPDVTGIPGVHLEVKRTEKLRLWEAVEQAAADAGPGSVPVVMHRANRRPWVLIVELDRIRDLIDALTSQDAPQRAGHPEGCRHTAGADPAQPANAGDGPGASRGYGTGQ